MLADNLHVLPGVLKEDPLLQCFTNRMAHLKSTIAQKKEELQELRWAYLDLYFEYHPQEQEQFLAESVKNPEKIKKQGDDYGRDRGWLVEGEDSRVSFPNHSDAPLWNYYEHRTAQLEKVLHQIECELREYTDLFVDLYREYKPDDYYRVLDEVTGPRVRRIEPSPAEMKQSGTQKIEIQNSEVKMFLRTLHLSQNRNE